MKKIAFIGAGSLKFTATTVRDILTFPAFEECEFALMDINADNRLKQTRIFYQITNKFEGCCTCNTLQIYFDG